MITRPSMKIDGHSEHNMPRSEYNGDSIDDAKRPSRSSVAQESDWTVRMEGPNRNKGDY